MKKKNKYSKKELLEFEKIILKKIDVATSELNYIKESLLRKNLSGTDSTQSALKTLEDGADTQEKENLSQLTEPIIIEIFEKDSLAMWQDKQPVLLNDHNEKGFSYLNESATQKEGFVNLHYISVSYDNLEYKAETSMPIKDDDSKYNFGFGNKMEISSIGYGSCKKIK